MKIVLLAALVILAISLALSLITGVVFAPTVVIPMLLFYGISRGLEALRVKNAALQAAYKAKA